MGAAHAQQLRPDPSRTADCQEAIELSVLHLFTFDTTSTCMIDGELLDTRDMSLCVIDTGGVLD